MSTLAAPEKTATAPRGIALATRGLQKSFG